MFENFLSKKPQIDEEELKKQTQVIEKLPLVISKPDNQEKLEKLEKKLAEYEMRMNDAKIKFENEPQNIIVEERYWDSLFKFTILGNLLHNGEVIENDIAAALSGVHNGIKYPDRLKNAFNVIKAYVEDGDVVGGTGLKK